MKPAVIVTTYNAPRLLGICLKSLFMQSDSDFDLWIADDGSSAETEEVIHRYQKIFGVSRLHHVWHEDQGYRKSAINNEVFRRVKGRYPYFILVDHDTIAHHRFIEDHKRAQEKSFTRGLRLLFMGRRIDLGPVLSSEMSEDRVHEIQRGLSLPLLKSWFKGETKNLGRAIRVASPLFSKLLGRHRVQDLLGSNFSIEASLLYDINGYNEEFKSYWGEDGDLFVRARNSGALLQGRKGYAIQFHLFHERLDPTPEHEQKYRAMISDSQYKKCTKGIE